jgi:hypothetical protein
MKAETDLLQDQSSTVLMRLKQIKGATLRSGKTASTLQASIAQLNSRIEHTKSKLSKLAIEADNAVHTANVTLSSAIGLVPNPNRSNKAKLQALSTTRLGSTVAFSTEMCQCATTLAGLPPKNRLQAEVVRLCDLIQEPTFELSLTQVLLGIFGIIELETANEISGEINPQAALGDAWGNDWYILLNRTLDLSISASDSLFLLTRLQTDVPLVRVFFSRSSCSPDDKSRP